MNNLGMAVRIPGTGRGRLHARFSGRGRGRGHLAAWKNRLPPGWVRLISPSALNGVLAQLVERLNGIEEVRGSNPLGSTFSGDDGDENAVRPPAAHRG